MCASRSLDPLDPKLQVSFYYRLRTVRGQYLLDSLRKAVAASDIATLNHELSALVPKLALQRIASFGLRGELFFPIPVLLRQSPFLLGYYRLLFGFSQKEFYNKGPFGRFRCMEERGELPSRIEPALQALCRSLIASGAIMAERIEALSVESIHDLQLLTLGPQWRGEENTRIGQKATTEVFNLIRRVVEPFLLAETRRTLDVRNAASRVVLIKFGSDPDIEIIETLTDGVRHIVSIEIKGGADASNIHNRLGEAEKSHQKAKKLGFHEFWTIVRVAVSDETVRAESPTTTRCFALGQILEEASAEHRLFVRELTARLGVQTGKSPERFGQSRGRVRNKPSRKAPRE